MPQTKYDVSVASKEAGEEIVAKTENVQGVKFVNVGANLDTIVVTHSDDYDEAEFKKLAGI